MKPIRGVRSAASTSSDVSPNQLTPLSLLELSSPSSASFYSKLQHLWGFPPHPPTTPPSHPPPNFCFDPLVLSPRSMRACACLSIWVLLLSPAPSESKNTGVHWELLFLPDYSAEINILSRSLQNCQVLSCSSLWSPKPSFSWVCVRGRRCAEMKE